MAVSVPQFREAFPAFVNTDAALVRSKIALAAKRVSAQVWGDMVDDGIGYLAAHLIAIEPSGEGARLEKDEQKTTYSAEFDRMKLEVAAGFRVI